MQGRVLYRSSVYSQTGSALSPLSARMAKLFQRSKEKRREKNPNLQFSILSKEEAWLSRVQIILREEAQGTLCQISSQIRKKKQAVLV